LEYGPGCEYSTLNIEGEMLARNSCVLFPYKNFSRELFGMKFGSFHATVMAEHKFAGRGKVRHGPGAWEWMPRRKE